MLRSRVMNKTKFGSRLRVNCGTVPCNVKRYTKLLFLKIVSTLVQFSQFVPFFNFCLTAVAVSTSLSLPFPKWRFNPMDVWRSWKLFSSLFWTHHSHHPWLLWTIKEIPDGKRERERAMRGHVQFGTRSNKPETIVCVFYRFDRMNHRAN